MIMKEQATVLFLEVNMGNSECFTKYCLHMRNGEKIVMLEEEDIDYEESIINEFSRDTDKILVIRDIYGNIIFVFKKEISFIVKYI